MENMDEDIKLSEIISKIIHFWWLLIVFIIAGGVLGLLFSTLHPAVYESKSVITTVIDYGNLGKLDDMEEDQLFVAVGDLIGSTSVKDKTAADAAVEDVALTAEEINDSLWLDRKDTRWVLRVRASDPQTALRINEIWTQAAMDSLSDMKENALVAASFQQKLDSLVSCFEQSVIMEPIPAECQPQNYSELRNAINELTAAQPSVIYDSLILSHTSFTVTTQSTNPNSPVSFSRNLLVLAGGFLGLIISLVLFTLDWPKQKNKKGTK